MSHISHIFPTKMTRKVVYYLRSNRIFMKRYVNGKQPVTTVPPLLEQRKKRSGNHGEGHGICMDL